jgi:hypothetical protein
MNDVAAIVGVVLLFIGLVLLAFVGEQRSFPWAPLIGLTFVVLGIGLELVGAMVVAG